MYDLLLNVLFIMSSIVFIYTIVDTVVDFSFTVNWEFKIEKVCSSVDRCSCLIVMLSHV